jgi:hypothetical protein
MDSLANETLAEVAAYLKDRPRDVTALMLVNKRLAEVCEYLRYSTLTVQGSLGRRLIATLLSGTVLARKYCTTVKRIWFRFSRDAEMYLLSTMMSDVLPLLKSLITLKIDTHTLDTQHALGRLRKSGVVRSSLHPASVLSLIDSSSSLASSLNLPSLSYFMVSGLCDLSVISAYRSMYEVNIDSFMDYREFAKFVSSSTDSILGASLHTLSLKFSRSISLSLLRRRLTRLLETK